MNLILVEHFTSRFDFQKYVINKDERDKVTSVSELSRKFKRIRFVKDKVVR